MPQEVDEDLFNWIKTSHVHCRNGDSEKCFDLGKFYLKGTEGFKPNIDYAKRYLEMGCDAGSGRACLVLSSLYNQAENIQEAQMYFAKAQQQFIKKCQNRDANSCLLFALNILGSSTDSHEDYPRAIQALEQGCDLGDTSCCTQIGNILRSEDHPYTDQPRAKKFLEKGCNEGDVDACYNCAELMEDNEALRFLSKQESKIRSKYQKSCDNGSHEACTTLGSFYLSIQKYSKAISVLQKPCEEKNAEACGIIGWAYSAMEKPEEANQAFIRACELGSSVACQFVNQEKE
mmetsp:Transcript_4624/g.7689  ORF Transcript_4624/g.7689 Transcript_4624/m.7689 type:complete len:289 (+) Transcript_4624:21-887(+)